MTKNLPKSRWASKSFENSYQRVLSWLHLKRISVHMAGALRATWALLFWSMWPAAFDRTLLLNERSLNETNSQSDFVYPFRIIKAIFN